VAPNGQPLASFGVDAARDGGLGMQRLVSKAIAAVVTNAQISSLQVFHNGAV
jgi:hypothetical protein